MLTTLILCIILIPITLSIVFSAIAPEPEVKCFPNQILVKDECVSCPSRMFASSEGKQCIYKTCKGNKILDIWGDCLSCTGKSLAIKSLN